MSEPICGKCGQPSSAAVHQLRGKVTNFHHYESAPPVPAGAEQCPSCGSPRRDEVRYWFPAGVHAISTPGESCKDSWHKSPSAQPAHPEGCVCVPCMDKFTKEQLAAIPQPACIVAGHPADCRCHLEESPAGPTGSAATPSARGWAYDFIHNTLHMDEHREEGGGLQDAIQKLLEAYALAVTRERDARIAELEGKLDRARTLIRQAQKCDDLAAALRALGKEQK